MGTVRKRQNAKKTHNKVSRRSKDKKRNINIASNPIIEANWDYDLTLKQNYKKLGLTSRLQKPSGGIEANLNKIVLKNDLKFDNNNQVLNIPDDEVTENDLYEGEARIIRDEETGEVLRVIYGKKKKLDNDYLLQDGNLEDENLKTSVIKQLEAYAASKPIKEERQQSDRESDWLEALYKRHGDDYYKMKWDKKLNIYQQSEGDLKKRILKWKKKNNIQ